MDAEYFVINRVISMDNKVGSVYSTKDSGNRPHGRLLPTNHYLLFWFFPSETPNS